MTPSQSAKYFILGSQRSGTTLLGLCLEAHPDIELIEENDARFHQPYFLTRRIDLGLVNEYKPPCIKAICFKSPRDSHRVKSISLEINPVKILWMRRSVYEVVASMLRPRSAVGGKSWAAKHAEHELTKYFFEGVYDPSLAKLYRDAVSLGSSREKMVSLACLCWIAKFRCELLAGKYFGHNFYRIDYEKLVADPESVMKSLLRFLELSWDPRVLKHNDFVTGSRPGGTMPERPIDLNSLNKWRSELFESDLATIDRLLVQCSDVNDTMIPPS